MQKAYFNPSVETRFRSAWERCRVVMISAPSGSGKTCAARTFLPGAGTVRYGALETPLSEPSLFDAPCEAFVIDDLHAVTEPAEQKALCSAILAHPERKFLLLSRGPTPGYLMPFRFSGLMETFDVHDLLLDRATAQRMLEENGAVLSAEDMTELYGAVRGYGLLLSLLSDRLRGGARYGPPCWLRQSSRSFTIGMKVCSSASRGPSAIFC